MRIYYLNGRCHECDGCMMCQSEREPERDEWDMDEDLLRDEEDD